MNEIVVVFQRETKIPIVVFAVSTAMVHEIIDIAIQVPYAASTWALLEYYLTQHQMFRQLPSTQQGHCGVSLIVF